MLPRHPVEVGVLEEEDEVEVEVLPQPVDGKNEVAQAVS